MQKNNSVTGYLPDERPPFFKLILFALQQIIVMFPATVLVALITGFHVSTTIFASGLATLGFILVTGRKIPLYYGSSFSYIAAISTITAGNVIDGIASNEVISLAQFGIIMSGLVSIAAGLIIKRFGRDSIEKVLPPTVTGSIALVIGLSLAANAISQPLNLPEGYVTDIAANLSWIIAIVTLCAVIGFSVYFKKVWGQLSVLLGLLAGYFVALILGLAFDIPFVDFNKLGMTGIINMPNFTFPKPSWDAVLAIMPIAIATIPESTAHVFQLDIYINKLAKQKGSKKRYKIADKLGLNLIGDGLGDIISGAIGGPAGTNYGENISTMSLTKNFSTSVLIAAAIITMFISFFTPLTSLIYSIPNAVIGGISIYLFGIIAVQGIVIIIEKKVDLFEAKNLAVMAVILIIGLGGSYAFANGSIPFFGANLPAIATAAIVGIVMNLLLSIGNKKEQVATEETLDEEEDETDLIIID